MGEHIETVDDTFKRKVINYSLQAFGVAILVYSLWYSIYLALDGDKE